jgi:hypothetical protein
MALELHQKRFIWFFTASNPTLTFGGLEGESKSEMYKQLPAHLCPQSIYITPAATFADVVQQVRMQRMDYPFIAKPDVGMKGILFRKIENDAHLEKYHRHVPVIILSSSSLTFLTKLVFFITESPVPAKDVLLLLYKKTCWK